jgi:hypothetical protein
MDALEGIEPSVLVLQTSGWTTYHQRVVTPYHIR